MSPGIKTKVVVSFLCFLAAVIVCRHILRTHQPATLMTKLRDTWKVIFDEPLNPDTKNCLMLFDKPQLDDDFYSATYLNHRRQFDAQFKRVTDTVKENEKGNWVIEGNSGSAKHQSRLYYWLAGRPWVNTICETGFNAGHSTLQWLTGSDHAKVYSFDLGTHYYTRPMADYLNRTFPGRLHLTFGNSLKTLPRFADTHRYVRCDVIVVDGGHSHSVAIGDLRNFRKIAHVERNVLVLDDTNKQPIVTAWNEMEADGLAVQRFACTDQNIRNRAYIVGYYV